MWKVYGVNLRERHNEEGHRRGKEQIICWHWTVKGQIKLPFWMYSNIHFEFQISIHCMPSPNSLFLVSAGNGVGWKRSIFQFLVPGSISRVMLKKAVTSALAQLLYSLSLRQSILAESASGDSPQSFMTVVRLWQKEPGCRGINVQSQICSVINNISGSRENYWTNNCLLFQCSLFQKVLSMRS